MNALAGREGSDLLTVAFSLLERDATGSLAFVPGFGRALTGPLDRAAAQGDGPAVDGLVRLSIALATQFRSEDASRALMDIIKGHPGVVRLLRSVHGSNDAVGHRYRQLIGGQASRQGPQYGQQAPIGTLKASSFVDPGRPRTSGSGLSARPGASDRAVTPASPEMGASGGRASKRSSAAITRSGDSGRRCFQLQQRGS